jgi:hypothetical protein
MRPATATRQDNMTTTSQRFNRALLSLAARGERPRCADPITHVMWTSMINTTEPSQPRGVPAVRWAHSSEPGAKWHRVDPDP